MKKRKNKELEESNNIDNNLDSNEENNEENNDDKKDEVKKDTKLNNKIIIFLRPKISAKKPIIIEPKPPPNE